MLVGINNYFEYQAYYLRDIFANTERYVKVIDSDEFLDALRDTIKRCCEEKRTKRKEGTLEFVKRETRGEDIQGGDVRVSLFNPISLIVRVIS